MRSTKPEEREGYDEHPAITSLENYREFVPALRATCEAESMGFRIVSGEPNLVQVFLNGWHTVAAEQNLRCCIHDVRWEIIKAILAENSNE